ncbi:hypothetical protein [Methylotuvimicrobium sp. KM2]|uniref:hypothetical protein n=1 Tax=Methylotuvimicrobium sp. KM2 TaxID=3133976 RepID=UPI003101AE5D
MPIKPKPFVYVCPSCGWRKSVFPRSDVLLPGEYYDCCPKCGASNLIKEKLSGLNEWASKVFGKFYY